MDYELLTYKELAERLGMKVTSVQRKVLKMKWAKHTGNDGIARVHVPLEVIDRPPPAPSPAAPTVEELLTKEIQGLKALTVALQAGWDAEKENSAQWREQAQKSLWRRLVG